MITSRAPRLWAVVLCLGILAGCAQPRGVTMVAKGDSPPKGGWGRTALVCETAVDQAGEAGREKVARIAEQARRALAATPGVEPLDAGPLVERLQGRSAASLGDAALAAEARAAGADTVVLVQVPGYGGELTISLLPPYWAVSTHYACHVRVLDARGGALYLDAQLGRRRGGLFSVRGPRELGEEFTAGLAGLFSEASGS